MPESHIKLGEVVNLIHHTYGRGGGMERYALDICDGFKTAGVKIIFHCHKADNELAREQGVEVVLHKISRTPRKLQDYRFFRAIQKATPAMKGACISLDRLRTKGLAVCGGTHKGYLSSMKRIPGLFDLLQIWMEREGYRSAGKVIAHSDLCRSEIINHYSISPEKVVTIHPPTSGQFERRFSEEERNGFRKQFGLPQDKVVFLFPSTGHKRKGLASVFEAMRDFGDRVILAIAGKPPTGFTAPFVKYLGFVKDMRTAFGAADFTILGSYYEPFGLVGIESILCGTRLVFEEKAGCLEVIKPEEVICFAVRDISSIRKGIKDAIRLHDSGSHRIANPAGVLTSPCDVAGHVGRLIQELRVI